MVTVYDVEGRKLVEEAAKKLQEMGIPKPHYLEYVKSGSHADRRPTQENFWYLRCASLLRKAYISPGIGVNRLRVHYGGGKSRGAAPTKARKSSGSIIRRGFIALEKAGLIEKTKTGRKISSAGQKLMDGVARQVSAKKE